MADETKAPPPPPQPPSSGGNQIGITIEEEMRRSYLDYSMSVIIGRALPDVRDGLKPVHRRVLYAMHELGNTHSRAYKKSARVVGDVIGKYHPHGDVAVYDTIVRMAQHWSMRYLLVDGQGNFGSIDGDSPAAMRYTEVRMEQLAEELLADLDKDTVDFGPNYDGSTTEPLVMPARYPNLLVNGSSGIAVGMTTNIPPHNMGEVIDAALHLIDQPKATIADLMQFVKGPDFPTRALITGRDGIKKAYETGRGHIQMKARAEVEQQKKADREQIVISEIPFQVNKARLIERIAELVREKKIDGISDIRDESDREQDVRIVVELKRDAIAKVVLNNLFALTPMQSTFGIIMLAIDQGQPRTMTLKEMLEKFILHRREVVTRRSRFELRKAEARLHIVEGLLVAQDIIDQVITIIRKSQDVDEARWGLMNILSASLYEHPKFKELPRLDLAKAKSQMDALVKRVQAEIAEFTELSRKYEGGGFSEDQAKNILDMRLQRLTGMQREELFKELIALLKEIARLKDILGNEASLLTVIKTELKDIRAKYADERRTEIIALEGDLTTEDLIAEETMVVTVSHAGYVKRTPLAEYRAQKRGGRGKTGATTKEEDFVSDMFVASTHAYLMPITTKGKLHWLKVHEIPLASRTSRGKPIVNLVALQPDEKLASILVAKEFTENHFVFFVTKKGVVKKTDLTAFSNVRSAGLIALGIDDGDALVSVKITDGTKDIIIATAEGMSIRFSEDEVRSMGRTAYGVKGISLDAADEVVGADVVEAGATVMTVTENGYGKRTEESEYRQQGRGGKGIIDIKTSERNGRVAGLVQVKDDDQVMILTNQGMLIRLKAKEVSVIGRNTQGVRMISLESETEKVAAISKLPEVTGEAEGEGGAEIDLDGPGPGGDEGGGGAIASADNVPGDEGDVPEPGETPDGTPVDES